MDYLRALSIIVESVPRNESNGVFYEPAFWTTFDGAAIRNACLDSVEIVVRCTSKGGGEEDQAAVTSFCEMVARQCRELGKREERKFKVLRDIV